MKTAERKAMRRFRENIIANGVKRAHGPATSEFRAGADPATKDGEESIGPSGLSDAQRIDASTPGE
jgi:hypothetical protein